MLAGINRPYLSMEKPKRGADTLRRRPIAPRDAATRVQAILMIDRRQTIATLAELIADQGFRH